MPRHNDKHNYRILNILKIVKILHNINCTQMKTWASWAELSCRTEPQNPPPLSLKLAPSTFILLGNFATLHFETAYNFPPCCIILKKIKNKNRKKEKKKTGGSAEEGEERELEGGRMGGESYCGQTAYTWVWFLLHPLLHHLPTQTELSFLPLTQTT